MNDWMLQGFSSSSPFSEGSREQREERKGECHLKLKRELVDAGKILCMLCIDKLLVFCA